MSEGPGMMETIEKVKNWDRETDYLFKAKYQKLLDSSFKEMEKAHIDTGPQKLGAILRRYHEQLMLCGTVRTELDC